MPEEPTGTSGRNRMLVCRPLTPCPPLPNNSRLARPSIWSVSYKAVYPPPVPPSPLLPLSLSHYNTSSASSAPVPSHGGRQRGCNDGVIRQRPEQVSTRVQQPAHRVMESEGDAAAVHRSRAVAGHPLRHGGGGAPADPGWPMGEGSLVTRLYLGLRRVSFGSVEQILEV